MISVETPIGRFGAAFSVRGLRRLGFPGSDLAEEGDGGAAAALLESQLYDYFRGRLVRFTVPLDLQGTAFQREVWGRVLEIPYGRTCTYSEVARAIGRPLAARAVGAANGANPVPILVPCHRLVGASGDLTGYGGGIELKRWLLRLEAAAA